MRRCPGTEAAYRRLAEGPTMERGRGPGPGPGPARGLDRVASVLVVGLSVGLGIGLGRAEGVAVQGPSDGGEGARQWPEVSDFVARFCSKRVQFSHVRVFSDSRNVQKRATKTDTSGHCIEGAAPPQLAKPGSGLELTRVGSCPDSACAVKGAPGGMGVAGPKPSDAGEGEASSHRTKPWLVPAGSPLVWGPAQNQPALLMAAAQG